MNEQLDNLIKASTIHREIFQKLEIPEEKLEIFQDLISLAEKIKTQVSNTEKIDPSYTQLYQNQISVLLNLLQFRGQSNSNFIERQNDHWKNQNRENYYSNILKNLTTNTRGFSFQVELFDKIGNFNSNIVIIGANGSGKTSLSEKLKIYLNNNGVVISAQRILNLPNFNSISNPETTATQLKIEQTRTKTYKNADDFRFLSTEFEIVLKHLLSENISIGNQYKKKATENAQNRIQIEAPPKTNLDYTFEIWNSLIEHRYLDCEDGINIKTYLTANESYPSIQMSDGEKVLLYLIAQVLQAPTNGFIVIDEPEMYLHKTILKKLWNALEIKRNDCLFIYLTHDLDFASSRNTAKKLWIKSYQYPDIWDIEKIDSEEIPDALLFELLGSKKNILFCEGTKGSIDEKVYSLLFPDYTITPVESCFNVINFTKAFNKINNIHISAYGIIDSDHHAPERLSKIANENILGFSVSEVENLFLDEEFLNIFATTLLSDETKITAIKEEIINELNREKELQISNYISARINNIFTDSDLSKGNTLENVKTNYSVFLSQINIDQFYVERDAEITKIVEDKDYIKAIRIFNNKGLKRFAANHFGVTDYTDKCLKLLHSKPDSIQVLRKYFPPEL